MASASPAPGALDSAKERRMEIQRLTELLQQKDAAPSPPTSSSNSVNVVDREVPSQGQNARTGTYLYAGSMPAIPKFDGEQVAYRMWRKQTLRYRLQMDCKTAIDQTPHPIKIGGEHTSMSELRRHHSAVEIEDAKRAWAALNEAITSPSLINKIYAQGSPSEAWVILEEWHAPRGVVMEKELTTKYEGIWMELGEDPQTYIGRIDDAVDMLESLGVPKTAKEVNRKIIRHLLVV